jgi:hypothetical protein
MAVGATQHDTGVGVHGAVVVGCGIVRMATFATRRFAQCIGRRLAHRGQWCTHRVGLGRDFRSLRVGQRNLQAHEHDCSDEGEAQQHQSAEQGARCHAVLASVAGLTCKGWTGLLGGGVRLAGGAPRTTLSLAGVALFGAHWTPLALSRVAAGGARWWLTATRSGAERADGPCGARRRGAPRNSLRALRALRSDSLGENVHEVRCAHRPASSAPRRAAEIATTGHRLPRRSVAAMVALYLRHASRPRYSLTEGPPRETRHPHHKLVAPGLWGPGAARLWGAEEHRACAQREARSSTFSSRLSERSAGTGAQ